MKSTASSVKNSVFLKVTHSHPGKVEVVDSLVITPAIKDKLLLPFLSSMYKSLLLRAEKSHLGVPRYALNEVIYFHITLLKYLSLPGLIGERVFTLFDLDRDGYLKEGEFQDGLCRLFSSTFEESIRLVYDLFDFDSDGKISKEDIRMLLSHVPLVKILELTKAGTRNEGQYTKQGGGLYNIL